MTDHGKYKVAFSLRGVPVVHQFVPHETKLQELKQYFLHETPLTSQQKVFVVYGLGGIGKTQLAIEFARKNQGRFSSVFWLDGSSETSLKQSFVRMALQLPREDLTVDGVEMLKQSIININIAVRECLRWLSLPLNRH
ncbi:hypothetical protein K469DRAFT_786379 [Zopfia rhizophila CBS 207.26]|uniref:NB-ARC domain-containing protein n=1 Tax=Zopfia rhizophila CBS 207.26 TaxID=1314779 RepID=A0A6A6DVK1_9PEZI|nr:hypothetical protein K469DRAFT_786379 [Zopfia rhizophila CBS 207.26]